MITPAWSLELVLAAFAKAPFEPIATCSLKHLTWKTAFLFVITSACRASEMNALSCKAPAPYLRFSNAGVMLFTRLSFFQKVTTEENTSRPIFVPAMHDQKDRALHRFRHALNKYLQRTSGVRQQGTSQLFFAYEGRYKGKPTFMQQVSKVAG